MRDSLDFLGQKHGTDKASQFTRTYAKPHDYLRHMEPFFEPMRDAEITLLEIGAAGGESIRTWLDFFTKATIIGVDIVKDTNPYNSVGTRVNARYQFIHGDQGSESFWMGLTMRLERGINVLVDDGSHAASDIITTFNSLWPHMAPNSVYVIEDLNCAYGGAPFTIPSQPTQMDFIKGLLDAINRKERQIERLQMTRELCIIQKSNV